MSQDLKSRVQGNLFNTYDKNKFAKVKDYDEAARIYNEDDINSTGRGLNTEKVENLAIIDIDIKGTDEDKVKETQEEYLKYLDEKDIIVGSASHGLHVYCNIDDFKLYKNRYTKIYSDEKIDVDLFAAVDPSKHSHIMYPGTELKPCIATNHFGEDGKYKFIKNDDTHEVSRSVEDVLKDLDILEVVMYEIERIENKEEPPQNKKEVAEEVEQTDFKLNNKIIKALIDGFDKFEIHHYTHKALTEEVSLMPLFQALNCIEDDNLRTEAYAKAALLYTPTAQQNFSKVYNENLNKTSSLNWLRKIIETHNPDYYIKEVKPLIAKMFNFSSEDIDLKNKFNFTTIQWKCEHKKYKSLQRLARDLCKVFAFVNGQNSKIYQKMESKKLPQFWEMVPISWQEFQDMTKKIIIYLNDEEKPGKLKKFTGFDAYLNYQTHFNIKQDSELLNWFIGYYYNPEEIPFNEAEQNEDLIKFMTHIKEINFNNDINAFNYWLDCECYKYRNHSRKNHFLIFQSEKNGTGKTLVMNILAELYRGYSQCWNNLKDALDPAHMLTLKNCLYIFIEEMPSYNDKSWNINILKNIINGSKTVQVRGMYKEFEEMAINFDICGTSNMPDPYYVDDNNERRLFITEVNPSHAGDFKYFNELLKNIQPKIGRDYEIYFMLCLSSYLYHREISEDFNLNNIPMTAKKAEMIETHKKEDKYIMFIQEYSEILTRGIKSSELINYINEFKKKYEYNIKNLTFLREFNKYTKSFYKKLNGKSLKYYQLTEEEIKKYINTEEEEEADKKDIIELIDDEDLLKEFERIKREVERRQLMKNEELK